MDLPTRLTALRDKRGVSDREIARSLGTVSPTTVGRWLSGKGEPSLSQAVSLANYFAVPIGYLAYDNAEVAPSDLPEDEAAVLRTYRNLKQAGALDEASATHGLALAASRSLPQRITNPTATPSPEAGFEPMQPVDRTRRQKSW